VRREFYHFSLHSLTFSATAGYFLSRVSSHLLTKLNLVDSRNREKAMKTSPGIMGRKSPATPMIKQATAKRTIKRVFSFSVT